jgi:hypothetical protein
MAVLFKTLPSRPLRNLVMVGRETKWSGTGMSGDRRSPQVMQ